MTDRLSRAYPKIASREWNPQSKCHLLYQDFSNRLVPYRRHPPPYRLDAQGVAATEVGRSLTLGRQSHGLDGFIARVATELLVHREVWLEVAFHCSGRQDSPFRVFDVAGVTRTEAGNLVQHPPKLEELPPGFMADPESLVPIDLETERMIHVVLPDAYPDGVVAKVVCDLANIDSSIVPDWVMMRFAGQRPEAPFYDVVEASRNRQLRIIQAGNPVGWSAREVFLSTSRSIGEYYRNLLELRFLHFVASMRASAEDALREALTRASEACGFTVSVTGNGIYTPQEVVGFIEEFEAGDLAFSTVHDIIWGKGGGKQPVQRRIV